MAYHEGVRKVGFLRKLKTMKKKLFVLYEDGKQPARLEYYDSEKKFKSGSTAKRSIILKHCLSINQKSDAKHKFAIALFTKDDCFSVVCDSEAEQHDWLAEMEQLQTQIHTPAAAVGGEGEVPRPNFEHIWQVQVKNKSLGGGKYLMPGSYRLCLTNKSLSFIKLNNTEPDIVFQLASIRRCGHTDAFFYMELGRSSCTGAGELWMQVEDTVIAQNMHEAILSSMKTMNTAAEQPHFRIRSHSSADKASKPICIRAGPTEAEPSRRTLPARSKTISASQWEHPRSFAGLEASRESAAADGRLRADSVSSHCSHRTDSSYSDVDLDPAHATAEYYSGPTSSATADSLLLSSRDRLDGDSYMDMEPGRRDYELSPDSAVGADVAYMDMRPGLRDDDPAMAEDTNGYTPMSPALNDENSYLEMGGTGSVSSGVIEGSPGHDPNDPYIEVAPVGRSLSTVQEKMDSSYMDMGNGSQKSGNHSNLRPDKVASFLQDDGSLTDFPKRTQSWGSKPANMQRAFAKQNYDYMDMKSGGNTSSLPRAESATKSSPKSVSAPHLPHSLIAKPGLPKPRCDSSSSSVTDLGDRFMELDFNHIRSEHMSDFRNRASSGGARDMMRPRTSSGESREAMRPRTSSGGARDMMRPRTSSCGQEFRNRTSSFGSRSQTLGRHESHRPRTSTICQESLRPRTSSFGHTGDMRPRSSSHGNARFRELRRQSMPKEVATSRHSSQESLKRRISSRESVSSATSDYLDMNPRASPLLNVAQRDTSGYLEMNPAAGKSSTVADEESSYMTMEPQQQHQHRTSRQAPASKSRSRVGSGSSSGLFRAMTSSSESLSSSSSDSRSKVRAAAQQDQGDYIDLDYNTASSSSRLSVPATSSTGSRSPKQLDDSSYVSYSPGSSSREHSPSMAARTSPQLEKVISPIREAPGGQAPPFNPGNLGPLGIFHGGPKGKAAKAQGKHEYVNVQYKQTETVYEQMEYMQDMAECGQPDADQAKESDYMDMPGPSGGPLFSRPPPSDYMEIAPAPKSQPKESDYMDLGPSSRKPPFASNSDYMEHAPIGQPIRPAASSSPIRPHDPPAATSSPHLVMDSQDQPAEEASADPSSLRLQLADERSSSTRVSTSSLDSEPLTPVLNYATLDLGEAGAELGGGRRSGSPQPGPENLAMAGLSYAQIDFKKSQDLQDASKREGKPPFDCL